MKKTLLLLFMILFSLNLQANPLTALGKLFAKQFGRESVQEGLKKAPKIILKEMSSDEQDDFYIMVSAFFIKSKKLTISEIQERSSISPMQIKFIINRNKKLFNLSNHSADHTVQLTSLGLRVYRKLESHLNKETIFILEELSISGVNHKTWITLNEVAGDDQSYLKMINDFLKKNGDLVETQTPDEGAIEIRFTEDALELFPTLKKKN